MKIKFSTNTIVVSLVIVGLLVGLLFTNVMAQGGSIDSWVKILAGAWRDGISSDQEFVNAMEFLIENGAIKVSDSGSLGEIPIGTIIDWYRPTPSTPVPVGFEIADGRMVTDRESPLIDVLLPDLREKFIMGAKYKSEVGRTGGGITHVHSLDPPPATTSKVGDHNHKWARFQENGKEWYSFASVNDATLQNQDKVEEILVTNWGNGVDKVGKGKFPIEADRDLHLFTDSAGTHSHTVDIPSFTSPDEDHQPPYIGLLKIMRVK